MYLLQKKIAVVNQESLGRKGTWGGRERRGRCSSVKKLKEMLDSKLKDVGKKTTMGGKRGERCHGKGSIAFPTACSDGRNTTLIAIG